MQQTPKEEQPIEGQEEKEHALDVGLASTEHYAGWDEGAADWTYLYENVDGGRYIGTSGGHEVWTLTLDRLWWSHGVVARVPPEKAFRYGESGGIHDQSGTVTVDTNILKEKHYWFYCGICDKDLSSLNGAKMHVEAGKHLKKRKSREKHPGQSLWSNWARCESTSAAST